MGHIVMQIDRIIKIFSFLVAFLREKVIILISAVGVRIHFDNDTIYSGDISLSGYNMIIQGGAKWHFVKIVEGLSQRGKYVIVRRDRQEICLISLAMQELPRRERKDC